LWYSFIIPNLSSQWWCNLVSTSVCPFLY
jgi:hypothetical protein